MKTRKETVIEETDWSELVSKTYGRPYRFQQQDGCMARGVHRFSVPEVADDFDRVTLPEKVNGEVRGVSFAAWLKRDPKQQLEGREGAADYCRELWWERNFYPDFQTVANDLCDKGLLKAGSYTINIDW